MSEEKKVIINSAGSKKGFKSTVFSSSGNWKNCIVVRPKNAEVAQRIASDMKYIVTSGNVSYSYGSKAIFQTGSNVRTSADCSSSISWIVQQVSGNSGFSTYTKSGKGDGTGMASDLYSTGLFMNYFYYSDGATTPLCTGDIIIYNGGGHCAVVMDATGRTGADWELYAGEFDYSRGYTTDWSAYGGGGEFEPRLIEPIIEPEEEYLPEELIEMIIAGEITKEELEEEYDMYYIYEGRGGYSPFGEVPLTNKSYAWNRFAEILGMGESCPLPQGSPGSWVAAGGGGFTCDMAPEVGAVMCFSDGDEGYACIIEFILDNEVLITSQVEDGQFFLTERTKRYGMWDFDNKLFTGFIHNPAAFMGAEDETALETFLRIAEDQVGSSQAWVVEQTGIIGPNGWSAAFIVACSKRAGSSLNIVVPNVDSVSTIGRVGVLRGMGTWKKGSIYGGGYEPSAGDIVIFRYNHTGKESIYKGAKAAIVVESDGESFEAVMGDDGGVVTKKSYSCNSPFIAGYFCPNWESIDGTTASKKEYRNIQGLYTNGVTKYDACARTVGHVNEAYKPSIHATKIKLAAINYTGLLANFYSVFGQAGISTASNSELVVDFWTNTVRSYYQVEEGDFNPVSGDVLNLMGLLSSGLADPLLTNSAGLESIGFYNDNITPSKVDVTNVVRECYNYIRSLGYNHAIACGILANIKAESGFNTGIYGDSGTSAGLMQWHNERLVAMKKHAGSDWANDIIGQLDYGLNVEVDKGQDKNMKDLRSALSHIANTPDGAEQAAAAWIRYFERPKGYNPDKSDYNPNLYKTRQEDAAGYYQTINGN